MGTQSGVAVEEFGRIVVEATEPGFSFFDPQRTLPGCEGIQEYIQSQWHEFAVRINGENRDLLGRPLGQQPYECTARETCVAVG